MKKNLYDEEVEIAPGITKRLGDMTRPELLRAAEYSETLGKLHFIGAEAIEQELLRRKARPKSRRKGATHKREEGGQ